ncbi:helix-turn-helix domain-containing protein [Streptacidiphilus sp. EB103A]|uniref:helix-turn-helix domain-containing protein n=1 Tax=Streptacidiphilus sp. EB103A TaxID=3156275 RepID=UPI0035158069
MAPPGVRKPPSWTIRPLIRIIGCKIRKTGGPVGRSAGRPERALTRDGSPVRELAFWLRDLRAASGLTYAQLAQRTTYSISTLQEATAGRRLPTLKVTLALAEACGGTSETWRSYWIQIRRALDSGNPVAQEDIVPPWVENHSENLGSASAAASTNLVDRVEDSEANERAPVQQEPSECEAVTSDRQKAQWSKKRLRLTVVGGITCFGVVSVVTLLTASSPKHFQSFASVIVQNKVAIGPSELIEDSSPSYLSSETISRCGTRGCKLQGTEMSSGAKLVVSCWTHGEEMTNADFTSAGISRNKGVASSDLWYRALWSDGRIGYISEVYIVPQNRGTMDLKQC